ncbi:Protein of unknown function [Pustulibacterium marinum]|uniref:DUF3667 domain-containing protein n=1 Tax=Pustulibacterium marinum TaxID=1224947 RepID=A0A1I7G6T4_9FLAO|nr:DUF3667 domain-containing protein [Pustulibacterium marinum]SFU44155.1 Protein of unknown function [Pustulibacterium marinum]
MLKLKKFNRKKLKHRGTVCLNCQHPLDLSDRYCPRCSQVNSTKRITFSDLFVQFFDTIFSYDSKFRKTIWILLYKPGLITKEYSEGKRLSYTNPFRFFLSLLFTYIILVNLTFDTRDLDDKAKKSFNETSEAFNSFPKDSIAQYLKEIDSVEISDNEKAAYILKTFENSKNKEDVSKKDLLEKTEDSLHYYSATSYFDSINTHVPYLKGINLKRKVFQYGIENTNQIAYTNLLSDMKVENSWTNRFSYKFAFNSYNVKEQPSLYITFLVNKLPFAIFFSVPILAFFIWLVYSKKRFYFMEHMVFCYQTLTVLVLSYLTYTIISILTDSTIYSRTILLSKFTILFILTIGNLFYLYKAMRTFYGQSRLKTILKYIYINTIFTILATVTLTIFIGVSFFLY